MIEAYDVWKEKKLYGKVSMGTVRATYVIDENQILRSIEYQITLILPEITQDLSGNKMLGKDRKMQIMVTAEVDRYNQGGIANKVQQYKTLVQEYME